MLCGRPRDEVLSRPVGPTFAAARRHPKTLRPSAAPVPHAGKERLVSDQTATISTPFPAPAKPAPAPAAARTKLILEGPIFSTLLRMSAPNVLNLLAFTGMVTFDGFFLGRLGSDALAGASLVFPWVMLVLQSTNSGMGAGVSL